MKHAIVTQRLPHLLMGGVLTALLVASSVVLPAAPAHAADHYLIDESVSEDLSFKTVSYSGEKDDLAETYETEDSKELCEKLKTDDRKYSKEYADFFRNKLGITHSQLDNCIFVDSLVFLEYTGKYDENLLKKISSEIANKINDNGELIWKIDKPAEGWDFNLGSTRVRNDIGIMRYRFPGKIKSLHPNAGKVSGNTWTLDDPPTEEEEDQIGDNKGNIIITAERHSSNLGLILGITIPAALIIVAVIVLLIVRSKRKKKQQNLSAYPAGSGTYPPSPFMPGNSAYPVQSPVPGYPAAPGAPASREQRPIHRTCPRKHNRELPCPAATTLIRILTRQRISKAHKLGTRCHLKAMEHLPRHSNLLPLPYNPQQNNREIRRTRIKLPQQNGRGRKTKREKLKLPD